MTTMRANLSTVALLAGLAIAASSGAAEQRCDTSEFPLSMPSDRFIEHDDGTVTDTLSGLMWTRCAVGQQWTADGCAGDAARFGWDALESAAEKANSDGSLFFNDWRVPSLRSLAMLIERQCQNPRTNVAIFPGTPVDFFWTSTLRPGDESSGAAYALSFGPSGVEHRDRQEEHHLRLVRTAQ